MIAYHHVDVFSPTPFSGNSLAVFPDARALSTGQMAAITKELRHFESIFLEPTDEPTIVRARVFDLIEELDFAGHPLIGAACVLHRETVPDRLEVRWTIRLNTRAVTVATMRFETGFHAELDQGRPEFLGAIDPGLHERVAVQLGLTSGDLHPRLPLEVVSTGLRYLVVPVVGGEALARAHIARPDFDALLRTVGAQYAYVLDPDTPEGRHWDHVGGLEDVATGSGAGCATAYLRRHGRIPDGVRRILRQGRFTGRPSEIGILALGSGTDIGAVRVSGDVAFVGEGRIRLPQEWPR